LPSHLADRRARRTSAPVTKRQSAMFTIATTMLSVTIVYFVKSDPIFILLKVEILYVLPGSLSPLFLREF